MAAYDNLRAVIAANIYQNNNNEVTADMVKTAMDAVVACIGNGYLYKGVATPATDPSTPDEKVFYLATEPGTYTNFGGIVVDDGEVVNLTWDGTSWVKEISGAASRSSLEAVQRDIVIRDFAEMQPSSTEAAAVNTSGEVVSSTTTTLFTYPVVPGSDYALSGYAIASYTLYFINWFDEDGNYISRAPFRGSMDAPVILNKQVVTAPEGAAYAKVNARNQQASLFHFYEAPVVSLQAFFDTAIQKRDVIDSLDSTATDKPLSAAKGKTLYDVSLERSYKKLTPSSISENTWVRGTGEIASTIYENLFTYPVVPGGVYYFNASAPNTFDFYYINWFDSAGVFISKESYRGPTTYYMQKIVAPEGAATVRMNVRNTALYLAGHGLFVQRDVDNTHIYDEQTLTNILLGCNSDVEILPLYINSSGKFASADRLQLAAIAVKQGEQYTIESSYGSDLRYAFATSDAQELGGDVPLVPGSSVVSVASGGVARVTIPAGCSFLLVNFSQYYGNMLFRVHKGSPSTAEKRKLRLLAIGNSYDQDALAYVPFIMRDMGVDADVEIGILMMSSSTIEDHIENFINETAAYTFYYYEPGASAWVNRGSRTIQWALESYVWDVISTHASSSQIEPALASVNTLANLLHSALSYPVRFAWIPGQIRPAITNSGANRSDETISQLFEASQAVSESIIDGTVFDIIIPVCAAVQNARTIASLKALGAYAQNELNTSGNGYLCPNDGVHLQEGLPCQLAAYTVILSFLDLLGLGSVSIYGEQTRVSSAWASGKAIPSPHGSYIEPTDDQCRLIQLCAIMAHKHPFEITDISQL